MTNLFYAQPEVYEEERALSNGTLDVAQLFGLTVTESMDLQASWERQALENESPEQIEKLLQFFGA